MHEIIVKNETFKCFIIYKFQQINVNGLTTKLENLETGKTYKIFVVSRNKHGTSLPSSLLLINITERGEINVYIF